MTGKDEANRWNRDNQTGVCVDVRQPDGSSVRSVTRSAAWDFFSGTPVVMVLGLGTCHLDRVSRVPFVDDDFEYSRAGGDCVCEACGKKFYDHPDDLDHPSYDGLPGLRRLCDGRLVKL